MGRGGMEPGVGRGAPATPPGARAALPVNGLFPVPARGVRVGVLPENGLLPGRGPAGRGAGVGVSRAAGASGALGAGWRLRGRSCRRGRGRRGRHGSRRWRRSGSRGRRWARSRRCRCRLPVPVPPEQRPARVPQTREPQPRGWLAAASASVPGPAGRWRTRTFDGEPSLSARNRPRARHAVCAPRGLRRSRRRSGRIRRYRSVSPGPACFRGRALLRARTPGPWTRFSCLARAVCPSLS